MQKVGYKDLPDDMKVQFACVGFLAMVGALILGLFLGVAIWAMGQIGGGI